MAHLGPKDFFYPHFGKIKKDGAPLPPEGLGDFQLRAPGLKFFCPKFFFFFPPFCWKIWAFLAKKNQKMVFFCGLGKFSGIEGGVKLK